ncbi:Mannose-specific lectin [Thalictrum thalictroides]|uniref:Mannose-specific lectin n=1 Tax=Thalictrum thalictroides TaxID=46969 RepID=A0A7J6VNL0_THATH|nr:Mannose-specific lectin [Thalictrum thalictroides]
MLVGAADTLFGGTKLLTNQYLENGSYRLVMKGDCNLVLVSIKARKDLWQTNTAGHGKSCNLLLQNNGNMVIFSDSDVVWASSASWGPNNKYILVLQSDGNLVIYGGATWESNTAQQSSAKNNTDPLV